MQNCIINEISKNKKEESYQQFILNTLDDFKQNQNISIKGKILHYLPEPTFYYYINVLKKTNINPFDSNILFCVEFINGEIPYVTILTDFIEPSLNDNRNYFRCLTKEHNYIFSLNKYSEIRNILEIIIRGIKNFLKYVREIIEINYFVYLGEYELRHIYQINDFLQNNNNILYRIFETNNNNEYFEKYIIFTNLYFIIFQPLKFDKCLIKILYITELNEINLIFDKNKENNSLILDLTETIYKKKLEFVIIDRKHILKKEQGNFNFGKEKNDIEYDYSSLIQRWFTHQNKNIILLKKYNSIIKNYRQLFNENRDKLEIISGSIISIEEFDKIIELYENILKYYENKSENNLENNERIHEIISNLVYICSELVNYDKSKSRFDNKYLKKIKKYIDIYK